MGKIDPLYAWEDSNGSAILHENISSFSFVGKRPAGKTQPFSGITYSYSSDVFECIFTADAQIPTNGWLSVDVPLEYSWLGWQSNVKDGTMDISVEVH